MNESVFFFLSFFPFSWHYVFYSHNVQVFLQKNKVILNEKRNHIRGYIKKKKFFLEIYIKKKRDLLYEINRKKSYENQI